MRSCVEISRMHECMYKRMRIWQDDPCMKTKRLTKVNSDAQHVSQDEGHQAHRSRAVGGRRAVAHGGDGRGPDAQRLDPTAVQRSGSEGAANEAVSDSRLAEKLIALL